MSTHVIGIKPPDDVWRRMKRAYDACVEAGVRVPIVVENFFEGTTPDPAGVTVELELLECVQPWVDADRTSSGFEVDVRGLPPNVTVVRFFNDW